MRSDSESSGVEWCTSPKEILPERTFGEGSYVAVSLESSPNSGKSCWIVGVRTLELLAIGVVSRAISQISETFFSYIPSTKKFIPDKNQEILPPVKNRSQKHPTSFPENAHPESKPQQNIRPLKPYK